MAGDFKVGDWVRGTWDSKPRQITRVDGYHLFWKTSGGEEMEFTRVRDLVKTDRNGKAINSRCANKTVANAVAANATEWGLANAKQTVIMVMVELIGDIKRSRDNLLSDFKHTDKIKQGKLEYDAVEACKNNAIKAINGMIARCESIKNNPMIG